MNPTLSIIVVLYNSADELEDCLASFAPELETGWAELILVDNASPDQSVAVARQVAPQARLISLDENAGFAGGVNAALPQARGAYTLLLNPDVTVPEGGLREVVAWMDTHPGVAAASPDLRGAAGNTEAPARAFPSIWRALLETSRIHKLMTAELRSATLLGSYWSGRDETDIGWVPGTAMFVRRAVIDEVGGLSASLFMYGEDIEWCWRIRRAGYRIGVCAGSRFVHHTSASTKRSWGDDASISAILSGVHQATRIMYGTIHARGVAASSAFALAVEGAMPGREAESAARSRSMARLWWELARKGRLTAAPIELSRGRRPSRYPKRRTDQPLVSICVVTFNGAAYVRSSIESALAQSYDSLEIVVADDASNDSTFEILSEFDDPRIRLSRNTERLGQAKNRNNVITRSHGEFVKFLDQDDLLERDCVSEMLSLFRDDPSVGLVFCRRRIIDEAGARDRTSQWARDYGDLHLEFGGLDPINDGLSVLLACLRSGLNRNPIGEPTAVMVNRDHLQLSGGFNPQVRQAVDCDLWYRLMVHGRVGFVDQELVRFRHGHLSETESNLRLRRGWLDRLWTLELLSRDPAVRAVYPEISLMLQQARREAWRTVAKLGYGANGIHYPISPYADFLKFRAEVVTGRRRQLAPRVA